MNDLQQGRFNNNNVYVNRLNEYDYGCIDNSVSQTASDMINNQCRETISNNQYDYSGYKFIGWDFANIDDFLEKLNTFDDQTTISDLIESGLIFRKSINKKIVDESTKIHELKDIITDAIRNESITVGEIVDFVAPFSYKTQINLVAQWEPIKYNIVYHNIENIDNENDLIKFYYISDTDIDLIQPITKYERFVSFCRDENLTDCENAGFIPAQTTGDIHLYVKWRSQCDIGKWWHIGNQKMCLSQNKPNTKPYFVMSINGQEYYALMSMYEKNIHRGETYKLKTQLGDNIYFIYDETSEY
jgi:hypothetical protein